MRSTVALILCIFYLNSPAQVTKYANVVYTAYFSKEYHEPLYVVYDLFQGGGDCDRSQFHFKNGDCEGCGTYQDYEGSGYDRGHLCNAEDEAFDCDREELTFRYYNCVPQARRLNRGIWKKWETKIRMESQEENLTIICGSIFGNTVIGGIAVPDYCWKLVYDSYGGLRYCLLFPNDGSGIVQQIELSDLLSILGYSLDCDKCPVAFFNPGINTVALEAISMHMRHIFRAMHALLTAGIVTNPPISKEF